MEFSLHALCVFCYKEVAHSIILVYALPIITVVRYIDIHSHVLEVASVLLIHGSHDHQWPMVTKHLLHIRGCQFDICTIAHLTCYFKA